MKNIYKKINNYFKKFLSLNTKNLKYIEQKKNNLIEKFSIRTKFDYLRLPEISDRKVRKFSAEYIKKGLNQVPDTFILYRIIGNDLFPRHKIGQSRENVKFILENENQLEACEKCWIVNRIYNSEEEKSIFDLLKQYNQDYIHIPFDLREYMKIGWDYTHLPDTNLLFGSHFDRFSQQEKNRLLVSMYRLKNNYVMNNNGARNIALREGKKRAKWVLPWDGNTFLTTDAWNQIIHTINTKPYLKYYIVPMTRVTDNNQLLRNEFLPEPVEEPQIIFRQDTLEEFNENYCYGRRPKVELFWRLNIPGKWDDWKLDPWDLKPSKKTKEKNQFGVAGWVARLDSGMSSLEHSNHTSFINRGIERQKAIIQSLRYIDRHSVCFEKGDEQLGIIRSDILSKEIWNFSHNNDSDLIRLANQLLIEADQAIMRGPYSVIDKKTLPPSGNIQDYWHPAPYWWPNPKTKDGLPYVYRDGERVPGTDLYELGHEKFDRTRLQFVFDDVTILALAWKFTNQKKYRLHALDVIKKFFIYPETRMNPHLNYAQVQLGHNNNIGNNHGIIEMKDLYYFLDAVRLIIENEEEDLQVTYDLKSWLMEYLDWLLNSPQGKKERGATNNHGTYYDLQIVSIANFLNDVDLIYDTLIRSQARISNQFDVDGSQTEELRRTLSAHYCCFNFQGWIQLTELAKRWGINFWGFKASNGVSLSKSAEWLLFFMGKPWPYKQIKYFDEERFLPILFSSKKYINANIKITDPHRSIYQIKPIFHPFDGIRPFWNLGVNIDVV
jgi:hypothetical protein